MYTKKTNNTFWIKKNAIFFHICIFCSIISFTFAKVRWMNIYFSEFCMALIFKSHSWESNPRPAHYE